tara:strand:- start:25656 stop:25967 length:312 start_codon:yes stop_codon:yes gene_type:complete
MLKLTFYVPETHVEAVKDAVFLAGGGRIGDYDSCCWQCPGQGQFRPLAGADPFIGNTGQVEQVAEYRVEMVCHEELMTGVIMALKAAHPYEEPAYDVIQMLEY